MEGDRKQYERMESIGSAFLVCSTPPGLVILVTLIPPVSSDSYRNTPGVIEI
jgi:hypothetical protein